MEYAYYTADAFTRTIFDGAQIAVFPQAEGLAKRQMQLIARELNLSQTVFVLQESPVPQGFRVKIFSPQKEEDFAAQTVIATAHVLASVGTIELGGNDASIVLQQNIGPIYTTVTQDQGRPVFIQFTMQSRPVVDNYVPTESELANILSIKASDVETKPFMPRIASCGFPYLIVPIRSYAAVRAARFNFNAWSESIAPATAAQEILLITNHTRDQDADFHGRLLGPAIGVNEDPPIGGALPAFTGYLCSHEHIRKGTYTFSIDRGDEHNRRSLLHLEMDNKQSDELTIRVGGEAVMVTQGTMNVPE